MYSCADIPYDQENTKVGLISCDETKIDLRVTCGAVVSQQR